MLEEEAEDIFLMQEEVEERAHIHQQLEEHSPEAFHNWEVDGRALGEVVNISFWLEVEEVVVVVDISSELLELVGVMAQILL